MKFLRTTLLSTALLLSASVMAHANEGYLVDSNNNIVKSGAGLCWHTGYWTPANAVAECDPVRTTPTPTSTTLYLSADVLFDFDKATLKPEGMAAIGAVVDSLSTFHTVEVIGVVGYTDRIGPVNYNVALSQRRADTISAFMVSRGVNVHLIVTDGKGKDNPVTGESCKGRAVTTALIKCLAPDRRVVVEIVGTSR